MIGWKARDAYTVFAEIISQIKHYYQTVIQTISSAQKNL